VSNICVIGTGYVGLVTGTCFADLGNQVICVDIVQEKIELLKQGILPIYEPGMEELVERNVNAGRLRFTTSYQEGLDNCEFIFIAVNTPTGTSQGGADMRYVESAARSIAEKLDHYAIIVNKSTVPVGSGDVVTRIVRKNLARPDVPFSVVSNPRGVCPAGFPESRSCRAWFVRPGGRAQGGYTVFAFAHAHSDYGPVYSRDDQVRVECIPGNKDFVYQ